MALLAHSSGLYGPDPNPTWGDGAWVVGWTWTGVAPGAPFSIEPTVGPVESVAYAEGGGFRGIRVLKAGVLSIDHNGHGGGVGVNGSGMTIAIRQNGAIISSQTYIYTRGDGVGAFGCDGDFKLSGIVAAAGDEFEVSALVIGWLAFGYYEGHLGGNSATHLRVTGVTTPGGGKQFLRGHVAL